MLAVSVGAYVLAFLAYLLTGRALVSAVVGLVVGTAAGVATGLWAIRRFQRHGTSAPPRSPVTWALVAGSVGFAAFIRRSGDSASAFVMVALTAWFGGAFLAQLVWTLRVRKRGSPPSDA